MAIECAGFVVKSQVIWDREWHGLGDLNGQFAPRHDVIWYATKGRFIFPNGRPHSVLRHKRIPADDLDHPNEKPTSLMQELSEKLSQENGVIFDPFLGSGTTGVAAVQLGRKFIGCEINPDYYAIAEKRIKQAQESRQLELM